MQTRWMSLMESIANVVSRLRGGGHRPDPGVSALRHATDVFAEPLDRADLHGCVPGAQLLATAGIRGSQDAPRGPATCADLNLSTARPALRGRTEKSAHLECDGSQLRLEAVIQRQIVTGRDRPEAEVPDLNHRVNGGTLRTQPRVLSQFQVLSGPKLLEAGQVILGTVSSNSRRLRRWCCWTTVPADWLFRSAVDNGIRSPVGNGSFAIRRRCSRRYSSPSPGSGGRAPSRRSRRRSSRPAWA